MSSESRCLLRILIKYATHYSSLLVYIQRVSDVISTYIISPPTMEQELCWAWMTSISGFATS
ncbi:hypothetical protein PR048_013754 [Dryococelus australis]|uniref:Uncharacterized protein n=1 Tax=Dryococelus australis TaxID=614101 RepID=A0ABQ9HT26_9NEOP|nr:hypothetical protein PR048_013754 [Dryococelus australis]